MMDPTCQIIAVGKTYTLRPTLGAAITLHRKYTMPEVIKGLCEYRLSIIDATLRACLPDLDEEEIRSVYLRVASPTPHWAHREMFAQLAAALVGSDPLDKLEDAKPTEAKTTTDFELAFRNLFKAATGVLHWTPAEAYAATPLEIILALDGYVEAHGGKADRKPSNPEALNAQAQAFVARWGAVAG